MAGRLTEIRAAAVRLALLVGGIPGHSRFCDLYVEWRHGITATAE